MQDHFSLTTRRAAEIAGVERHVLLTSLQRHGHWKGVAPRRLPNRRLLWPAVAVYQALGKLPPYMDRSPAGRLRQHLSERAPLADPYHVHLVCEALLSGTPQGRSPAECFEVVRRDLDDLEAIVRAVATRVCNALNDEEHADADDWRTFAACADRIEAAAGLVVAPLRWRSGGAQ